MQFIDSHCHLDLLNLTTFDNDLKKLIVDTHAQGISHLLNVSVDFKRLPTLIKQAESFSHVFISCGLHPNEDPQYIPSVEELINYANHPKIVAMGETGLDYYRTEGDVTWQHRRFRNHIIAAKHTKNPLIIHSRQAKEDTLTILREEQAEEIGGVLHCFTEDWDMAKQALDLNFYVSFSGVVTFKNAIELQDVAKKIPLDRMLIETDSPYLAPIPMRGKPNFPSYVKHVAAFVAGLRGLDVAEVAAATTQNFFDLFKKVEDKTLPLIS